MEIELLDYMIEPVYEATFVCQKTKNNIKVVFDKAVEKGHTSLLEHMVFSFSIKDISRACSHQLVRHRIASYAQESQRYVSVDREDWYVVPKNLKNYYDYHKLMEVLMSNYRKLISQGIPLEDARYVLPNSCKTNLIMTINGRSLDNFLTLRTCSHAQWEIRELANLMYQRVKVICGYFTETSYPKCKECKFPCKKEEN
jgi:thymidylate synthase (FAD)